MKAVIDKISKDGFFFITAADHRESLMKMLGYDSPEEMIKVKDSLARILSPHSSGFLLDPIYGQEAIKHVKCGLLLCREKTGYVGNPDDRRTILMEEWNVKKLKELGAHAIKLLVYYNPEKESSKYQEAIIKEVSDECHKEGIPFVCEFALYDVKKDRDEYIVKSAERISKLGIDVLKTEAPNNLKYCKKLSEKIKIPWIVLSGGRKYDEFKELIKIAAIGGASGFAGGRAIWQDTFKDEKLIKDVSVQRLKELSEIVRTYGSPIP
ncbi:MAG: tagatose 1,6-diphosphate aldolase [Candidatus Aenigmarchaeota archaeon]|nr:tagatose 1,6-diphosphate aldolase [Candidatus Aenigmarchaeota archaeon]